MIKWVITTFLFPLILGSFIWTNKSTSDVRGEYRLDMQIIKVNMAQIDERVRSIDKKLTKIQTLAKLLLKDAYGIKIDND